MEGLDLNSLRFKKLLGNSVNVFPRLTQVLFSYFSSFNFGFFQSYFGNVVSGLSLKVNMKSAAQRFVEDVFFVFVDL